VSHHLPTQDKSAHRTGVTYTRCFIDTIGSPYDENEVARNM